MWDLGLGIFHVGCQQLRRVRALIRERLQRHGCGSDTVQPMLGGWRWVGPTVGFSLDSFHISIVGFEMAHTL